jgi:hypothetical protein
MSMEMVETYWRKLKTNSGQTPDGSEDASQARIGQVKCIQIIFKYLYVAWNQG